MEPKNISLTAQMEIEAASPDAGDGPPHINARRGLLPRRANVDDNPRGCFAALHKPRHRSTTPKSRDAKYASPGDALRGLCFFRCLGGHACPPYDLRTIPNGTGLRAHGCTARGRMREKMQMFFSRYGQSLRKPMGEKDRPCARISSRGR